MIGYLSGRLLLRQPPFLLLDVNGVGYELEAPMTTFYALPEDEQPVALFVHMLVREDALRLFGFSDQSQRELFRSLLKINGVGPRVALATLSTLSAAELIACIRRQDAAALASVPGIGKKTAERMILDMRDRIGALSHADAAGHAAGHAVEENPAQDAIGALLALGYKPADANRAVRAVEAHSERREDLIRNALQYFSQ